MQVARATFDRMPQQFVDVHPGMVFGMDGADPES
jgi:hypothetical protein